MEEDQKVTRKEIQEAKGELKQKTNMEETVRLWKRFQQYAEYGDLKDLYQKVMPQLRGFEERLMEAQRENTKFQEILRRFDEVLTDKASKQDFREAIEKFDEYIDINQWMDYKADLNASLSSLITRQDVMESNIDLLGQSISKDIYQAVKKATGHLR